MRATASVGGQDKGTRLVQWTDDSGAGYGDDPYGGAYAYGYAHEYGTGDTTDTVAQPWDPGASQPAAWTRRRHPTAQDSPHGDVLTAPLPVCDTAVPPVPGPETSSSEAARPVFVDSSGRRQRRVVRAARLLVIPAGGYVALLISTLLGGPTVSSPFVPEAGSPHAATPRATAPDASSGAGHAAKSTGSLAARPGSGSTGRKTTAPATAVRSASAPTATAAPAPAPTRTAAPTATAAPSAKGRALGSSHRPVK
jgi:hypothetical protein